MDENYIKQLEERITKLEKMAKVIEINENASVTISDGQFGCIIFDVGNDCDIKISDCRSDSFIVNNDAENECNLTLENNNIGTVINSGTNDRINELEDQANEIECRIDEARQEIDNMIDEIHSRNEETE